MFVGHIGLAEEEKKRSTCKLKESIHRYTKYQDISYLQTFPPFKEERTTEQCEKA